LKDLAELPTLKEFQEIGRMDTESSGEAQSEQPGGGGSEPLLFPRREPVEEPTEPEDPPVGEPRPPEEEPVPSIEEPPVDEQFKSEGAE
jgi:hypothetical protein